MIISHNALRTNQNMEDEAELEECGNDEDNLLSESLDFQSSTIGSKGGRKWKLLVYLQCCKFNSKQTAFRYEVTNFLTYLQHLNYSTKLIMSMRTSLISAVTASSSYCPR